MNKDKHQPGKESRFVHFILLTRPYSWVGSIAYGVVVWLLAGRGDASIFLPIALAAVLWIGLNALSEAVQRDPGRNPPGTWVVVAIIFGCLCIAGIKSLVAMMWTVMYFIFVALYASKRRERWVGLVSYLIRGLTVFAGGCAIYSAATGRWWPVGEVLWFVVSQALAHAGRNLVADIRDMYTDENELPARYMARYGERYAMRLAPAVALLCFMVSGIAALMLKKMAIALDVMSLFMAAGTVWLACSRRDPDDMARRMHRGMVVIFSLTLLYCCWQLDGSLMWVWIGVPALLVSQTTYRKIPGKRGYRRDGTKSRNWERGEDAKKMSVLTPLCALLIVMVLAFGACGHEGSQGQSGGGLKLGEFTSLTGATAAFGISEHNGVVMAIEDANAKGGLPGGNAQLVTEDDRGQPGESATVVRKLISEDGVAGLIGEIVSSRSLEAAPIAEEAGIPMISPASTAQKLTKTGDCIFRVCFIDSFQGSVLAKFALESGYRHVAILTDIKSDYSMGLTQAFKERFLNDGGKVVREQAYDAGDKDFRAQLTSINAAGPDAIFIPGYYADVALIAIQARQFGIKLPLFGGDGWDSPNLVMLAGGAIEGACFSTHFSPDDTNPEVKNFEQRYEARFQRKVDVAAALGYDAAGLFLDAMRRANSVEPQRIREALANTRGYAGVTGLISIDEDRNAVKPAVILEVKSGVFHYLKRVAPDS